MPISGVFAKMTDVLGLMNALQAVILAIFFLASGIAA